jgi:hypothetical protein
MAFLFTVEEKRVRPTTEVLMISPFKEIWERDESKHKELALNEFAYIEFMTSQKKTNPFRGYSPSVKEIKVKENSFGRDSDWEPDSLISEGIQVVMEFQEEASETFSFLMSAKKGAQELKNFFNNLNMNDVNLKTGAPIYKPRDITSALKDTDDVVTKLDKLQKKVDEELFDKVVTKANKEVSPFADPDSM